MAEIKQVRKCYSCGAILQGDDPNKEGYVKPEILEKPNQMFIFCNKCFENEKYHARPNEPQLDPDFLTILKDAKEENALIVYVINLYSFEASFNKHVNDMIRDLPILVLANKRDLLPLYVSDDSLIDYVAHRFRASGLNADEVILSDNKNDDNLVKIVDAILKLRKGRNVYFIGPKMSGKTTIVNACLRVYKNDTGGNIVTEDYHDTNLRVMKIPLDDRSFIFDTAGISIDNSILYNADNVLLKGIFLKSRVKARSVRLSVRHSVAIGGLVLVTLLEGKPMNLTLYFHDNVVLKRIGGEDHTKNFISQIQKGSLKPSISSDQAFFDFYELTVTEVNLRDIGIQGLGWFSFPALGQKFRIAVPKGVSIYTSRAKIPLK